MLYLSQFVFQSILFSKKKEHAGDSGHPPVPSGEGAALLPYVARAALTSPSLATPPPNRLQAAHLTGRELLPLSHFHLLGEEARLAGHPSRKPSQRACACFLQVQCPGLD